MANHRSLHANRIARFLTLALAAALVIPPIVLSSSATATNLAAEGWMSASAAATGWEAEYRAAIWGQRGGRGGGGGHEFLGDGAAAVRGGLSARPGVVRRARALSLVPCNHDSQHKSPSGHHA